MDELTLECEPTGERDRASLRAEIEHALREETGLRIEVACVEPGTRPAQRGQGGTGRRPASVGGLTGLGRRAPLDQPPSRALPPRPDGPRSASRRTRA